MTETRTDPVLQQCSRHFRAHGYSVLRGVLSPSEAELCAGYALLQSRTEGYYAIEQPLIARGRYADALSEALLLRVLPLMEKVAGESLFPCYSYLRIYQNGAELPAHLDRPSCEISTSLTLGSDGRAPWPLCVKADGQDLALQLAPGDMLAYRGAELPHWRERFEGRHWIQVFLHYVRAEGPYADYRFDGREHIGPFDPARQRRRLPADQPGAAIPPAHPDAGTDG
ncbi:hypothetical protein [Luteimonas vadosa]|uniref:Fe2OG dioxygenase domain-containing protein n=1 Tax=Luteimonas vadosa TaxID=1165507 RepID=A0ABP9E412_9GAMM